MRISIIILFFLLIGVKSLLGQSNEALSVVFTEIDSLDYADYKRDYLNDLLVDTTKKTIPDSSFALVIKNEKQQFDCQYDYNGCYYYKGFIPILNSFVISHCGMLTCETFIIDRASGEKQYLLSPYDNECETPLISKDQSKILVFASNIFTKESFISVYQRSDLKENFNFNSFTSLTTDKWKIYEAVWINDTDFALITYDHYGGNTGSEPLNVKYIKGSIK